MSNPSSASPSTRRLSRRGFLRLAGLGAGALLAPAALAACAPPAAQPLSNTGNGQTVQLVYQDWRTEWFPPLAQEMLGEFHKQYPNIRVFYTPDPDNLEERMIVEMEAGTASDLISGCCDFFPEWAQKGYMLDLRPYVEADLDQATIDDWSQAQYRALFTRSGVQFGLPKYHGALALYYNKDLFDAAGIAYPTAAWTLDDYLEAMRALTVRQNGKVTRWGSMFDVSWERIQIHVNAWGGHFVDPDDPARCRMADEPALQAMEWLRKRIWDDEVMASFLDVDNIETRQAFIDQKIAMVEDGSWALKDILAGAKFRIGVAPFPAGPARKVTLATTDGFGIYARTAHPDAAWTLLKFLVSPEYGRGMARAHFLQPARASLVPDWAAAVRTQYPEQTRDVDLEAFADGHIKGYSVTAETFPNMEGVGKLAGDAWDRIFTLGQAPVSIMADIAASIQALQTSG